MLARRPAGHIAANRTQPLQGREAIDPIDLGQVHPGHRLERGLPLKAQRVAPACAPCARRRSLGRVGLHVRHTRLETPCDVSITRPPLLRTKIILGPPPAATPSDARRASGLSKPS